MKDRFKCKKTSLYRSCPNCESLNGGCDYSNVVKHKDKLWYNPCPICLRKYSSDKCEDCSHFKNKKIQTVFFINFIQTLVLAIGIWYNSLQLKGYECQADTK